MPGLPAWLPDKSRLVQFTQIVMSRIRTWGKTLRWCSAEGFGNRSTFAHSLASIVVPSLRVERDPFSSTVIG